MVKLNWKRLLFAALLLLLILLLLRGLLFSCRQKEVPEQPFEYEFEAERMLSLYLHRESKLVSIGLEEYLVGVVAAEMPASFKIEALKAQAVAARTYALRRVLKGGCSKEANICSSSSCCQAYKTDAELKKTWGTKYKENLNKIREAVKSTEGEALFYNGELIEALYHAASGGYTEDSENVFAAKQPYLRSVKSESETGSKNITSTTRLSRKAFVKAVNSEWSSAKLKASTLERQVKIVSRFESGRVECIKLGGAQATGRELRGLLELKSAWFTLEFTKTEAIFHTRGFGHGVGMSQAGANGMASEGANYKAILSHYYTGATISR